MFVIIVIFIQNMDHLKEEIEKAKVVASDVVEVNPRLDSANGITSINAARIVFEILACYWERDNRY